MQHTYIEHALNEQARKTRYYVCDACGTLEAREQIPEGGEWSCPECECCAAWEFGSRRNADQHAAHIQRGNASGLFRRVNR